MQMENNWITNSIFYVFMYITITFVCTQILHYLYTFNILIFCYLVRNKFKI